MKSPRGMRAALAAGLLVLAVPGTARADAAAPSDWSSEIVSIEPATDAVTATIEGGDTFIRIEVAPGHEVVVEGYADEPYLWIDADGTVYENQRSPATYYNSNRSGVAELPPQADAEAEPDWKAVGDGGVWAWHDHRAHWMGGRPPDDMQPGDSRPPQTVPLTVDGVATGITVVITLEPSPSPWPTVVGILLGLALAVATAIPRRRVPVAAVVIPVSVAATAIGLAQYLSLPPETDPRLVWWIPPVIAAACGAALVFVRDSAPFGRAALVLISAVQLAAWGWIRRDVLGAPVLPTSAPFGLDRLVTATALTTGLGLIATTVVEVVRLYVSAPRAPSATPTPDHR